MGPAAKAAWPEVKNALRDDDATVRGEAVRFAGAVGKEQPEVVPALEAIAVRDPSVETRLAAIQELGQLGDTARAAVPALTRLAGSDTRASVREAAAVALKKIEMNR
jgi:HEAT repeat protein